MYKTEAASAMWEDLEVDLESGQVRALVLPGRRRLFGLLGREEDRYIPWDRVRRFGEDIILVEQEPLSGPPQADMTAPRRSNRTGGALPDGRTKLYSKELVPIAHHKDEQHDQGQNIGHIKPHPSGEFPQSAACVGLRQEAFPAPAAAGDAEQQIDQRSQRQDIVADNKVLQIHNGRSLAEGLDPERTLKPSTQGMDRIRMATRLTSTAFFRLQPHFSIEKDRMFSKTAITVVRAAKDMNTKTGSPTAGPWASFIKDVGQGDENQVGARIGGHVKAKAGRENDQARRKGHKGIQHTHPDGLAGQGWSFPM